MKTATLALLALLLARPAMAASEMTAGDLYSLCTSADDLTSCNFYIFGVRSLYSRRGPEALLETRRKRRSEHEQRADCEKQENPPAHHEQGAVVWLVVHVKVSK